MDEGKEATMPEGECKKDPVIVGDSHCGGMVSCRTGCPRLPSLSN